MERLIEVEDPRELAPLGLRGQLAIDLAQPRDDLLAMVIRQARRRVCRQALEVPDD